MYNLINHEFLRIKTFLLEVLLGITYGNLFGAIWAISLKFKRKHSNPNFYEFDYFDKCAYDSFVISIKIKLFKKLKIINRHKL